MSAEEIIDLCLHAASLKRLTRTGWDLAGIQSGRQESVAEHSWGTTFLSLVIGNHLSMRSKALDLQKLLFMAIIHDLAESLVSDIPYSALILGAPHLKEGKSLAEKNAIDKLFGGFSDLGELAKELFDELGTAKSVESRIVLSADVLDMLLQAIGLERSGVEQHILESFFESGISRVREYGIPIAIEIADLLHQEHKFRAT